MTEPRRILIVDDNPAIHDDYRKMLRTAASSAIDALEGELFGKALPTAGPQYTIDSAYQGQEALALVTARLASGEPYALAFVDMRMPPGWDGIETIAQLFQVDSDIQVVICTAYADYSWDDLLARFGNTDRILILRKPFDTAEVSQLASSLTEKWRLARAAKVKLDDLQTMVDARTQEFAVANLALRTSEARYALAAAGSNDGLWDWSVETGEVYLSARSRQILGYSEKDPFPARPEQLIDVLCIEDRARVRDELADHLAGSRELYRMEARALHRAGGYRWVSCRGIAVRDETGRPLRMAGSITDITDRKLAEEQLRHDALHDALTGLANRALFCDRVRQCILRRRRSAEVFAVMFIDLDRFKGINDTLGHHIGDQVLLAVADRLVGTIRQADSVMTGEVGRLGGDEFVILLRDLRGERDAVVVADRIRKELDRPFAIEPPGSPRGDAGDAPSGQARFEIAIGASIGIALGRDAYERPEDLIRDADTAMYRAKTTGRTEVWSEGMHESARTRWSTENDLRGALSRGELFVEYQPVIDLTTEKTVEIEALLRWRHPARGLISPAEFIPLAEDTGLIVPIGEFVLRTACEQLARWRREIPAAHQLAVAVNMSAKQFTQPRLAEEIADLLRDHGLASRDLRIEITESMVMGGEVWKNIMGRLDELGVGLHLDDFGTGCSSLAYLSQMPISSLKIDRSFVAALTDERPPAMSAVLIETIVALAHRFDMSVIAEGVETQQQLSMVRRLGCEMAQGYYFGRPMGAEAMGLRLAGKSG
jgi:diguanylate cyclase (GGDEF)-like protein/PAS domain S-box-containing protein